MNAQSWAGVLQMADRIIRHPGVKEKTGLGVTAVDRLEKKGDFPKRIKITERAVGWSEKAVDKWVDDRLAQNA